MKYIIFLILLISNIVLYFYSDKKVTLLRNELLAFKRQNNTLKSELSKVDNNLSAYKNIIIIPTTVENSSGIVKKSTEVYIGPLNNLPVIYTTDVNMEVKIFDKVLSNNEPWYYIELPIDSDVNSRGWAKGTSFSAFGNSFSNNTMIKRF